MAQLPSLVDELEAFDRRLEEDARRAWAAEAADPSEDAFNDVWTREYELRLLRKMRAQLPAPDPAESVVLVGPSELMRELVRGALRRVVDALSDYVDANRPSEHETRTRLVATARAAYAWAQTWSDCEELELFRFDPPADPFPLR